MTNISQNDGNTDPLHLNDAANLNKSDVKADTNQKIKRGFSNKNSSSNLDNKNILSSNVKINRPIIDTPKLDSSVENKAMEEVMSLFSSVDQGTKKTTTDFLNKINKKYVAGKINVQESDNLIKNSLNLLKNNTNKNQQTETITNDAKNLGENLNAGLKANSNDLAENQQSQKLVQVANLFYDAADKIARIKHIPDDLTKDLLNDFKSLTQSIANGSKLDVETALLALNSLTNKLSENRIVLEKNDIKSRQATKEKHANEEMKKILESIDKAKEAEKSGVVGKILGYVGVAFMLVTSAIMVAGAVFTGGTSAIVAAALIVTATSLMVTMQASQETGGWLTKIAGEDNEFAMQMALIAIVVVLSIGAGAASSGMAAGGNAANAAAKLAQWERISSKLTKASVMLGSLSQAGGASVDIAAAHSKRDAEYLRSDALKLRAKWLYDQIMIDENRARFEELVQDFIGGDGIKQKIAEILNGIQESKTKLARNNS